MRNESFMSFRSRIPLLALILAPLLAAGGCAHDPADAIDGVFNQVVGPIAAADVAIVPADDSGAPVGASPVAYTSDSADHGPYQLDTGDKLRIFVYGQPNLSRAYTVDHEGRVTVPLIGGVEARGLSTSDLEGVIRQRLGAEFVRDPQVTVEVIQNRPFFIFGEVRQAGQYPYVSGMTVETAVAIAGGYSERARLNGFRVTRRSGGYVDQMTVPADYTLKPGDTVYVSERFF